MSDDFIECSVCGKLCAQITWAHVMSHGLTMAEYKAKFPEAPIISATALKKKSIAISLAKTGRPNGHKNKKISEEQKDKISKTKRAKFASGETVHWNLGNHWSQEVKDKIQQSNKERYTLDGYTNPMLGKKHSIEVRNKISEIASLRGIQERNQTCTRISDHLKRFDIQLLGRDDQVYFLKCEKCETEFTRTTSVLSPCQYEFHDGKYCPTCYPPANCGYYSFENFERYPELKSKPGLFYIVRMSSEDEEFVKVGITSRTVADRYRGFTDYRVTSLFEYQLPLLDAFRLEQDVLLDLRHLKYIPKREFGGMYECLTFRK